MVLATGYNKWNNYTVNSVPSFTTDNVVATGGNVANGAGNNVYTGGNGINAWEYGNNAVLTGGNVANGLGNNIGTGGNQINAGKTKQRTIDKCVPSHYSFLITYP